MTNDVSILQRITDVFFNDLMARTCHVLDPMDLVPRSSSSSGVSPQTMQEPREDFFQRYMRAWCTWFEERTKLGVVRRDVIEKETDSMVPKSRSIQKPSFIWLIYMLIFILYLYVFFASAEAERSRIQESGKRYPRYLRAPRKEDLPDSAAFFYIFSCLWTIKNLKKPSHLQ